MQRQGFATVSALARQFHWGCPAVSIIGFIFFGWSDSPDKALLISCQEDKHLAADVLGAEWRLQCPKLSILSSSSAAPRIHSSIPSAATLCPLQTVILQPPAGVGAPTASAAGEPLLLSLASPPLLEVPGTGNDPTSWRFRYMNRVLPQFLTASL